MAQKYHVMAALPNIQVWKKRRATKTHIYTKFRNPFLVSLRKVWLTPTARVPCSNAATIGECKTWNERNVNFAPDKIPLGDNSPQNVYILYQPGDGQTSCKVWLSDVGAVTKPKRETRYWGSPYCEGTWRICCYLKSFFFRLSGRITWRSVKPLLSYGDLSVFTGWRHASTVYRGVFRGAQKSAPLNWANIWPAHTSGEIFLRPEYFKYVKTAWQFIYWPSRFEVDLSWFFQLGSSDIMCSKSCTHDVCKISWKWGTIMSCTMLNWMRQ